MIEKTSWDSILILDVTILFNCLITSEQKHHLIISSMKVDIVIIFLLRTHCTHSTFNISRIPVWFKNILILNLFSQTVLCLDIYRLSIYICDSIIIYLIFFSRKGNISMFASFYLNTVLEDFSMFEFNLSPELWRCPWVRGMLLLGQYHLVQYQLTSLQSFNS